MTVPAGVERWARFGLSVGQTEQLTALLAELAADPHAPTAVSDFERAARVHVDDALVALELDSLRGAKALADLGSGAGFPGLALAVALPASEVWLVESQRRRCAFIEHMRDAAGVENVNVVCGRAEEWGWGVGRMDAITARALAPQPVVLEYAAPLMAPGGVLVDWRGRREEGEESAAVAACSALGLRRLGIRAVDPFPGAEHRHLHVFEKIAPTPGRFPRRAGMARKRPLGR